MGKRGVLLASFLAVLLAVASSVKTDQVAKVIGVAKCSDCIKKNNNSFKGLHVAVLCMSDNKYYEPEGLSEMTKEGMFNLNIRSSLLKEDGSGLKSQCYAQLYSSSKNTPCPTQSHSDHFKLVLSAKDKGVHVFGIAGGKLSFSRAACDEKTFWPHPFFKLPPLHPWKKYFPKFPCWKPKPPPNPKPPTYRPPMKTPPKTPPPTYKPPKPKPPTYSPPKTTPPTYKPPKHMPPTYTPKPKPPTYTPNPTPPTYTPKRKPPTYTPSPTPPTYTPKRKPPTYTPSPTPPTYTPKHKPPTYTPPKTPRSPPMKPKFPWHHHIEFPKYPPSLGH